MPILPILYVCENLDCKMWQLLTHLILWKWKLPSQETEFPSRETDILCYQMEIQLKMIEIDLDKKFHLKHAEIK